MIDDWKTNVFDLELLTKLKKQKIINSRIDFNKMKLKAELMNRIGITERQINDLNERLENWKECILNDTEKLDEYSKELELLTKKKEWRNLKKE